MSTPKRGHLSGTCHAPLRPASLRTRPAPLSPMARVVREGVSPSVGGCGPSFLSLLEVTRFRKEKDVPGQAPLPPMKRRVPARDRRSGSPLVSPSPPSGQASFLVLGGAGEGPSHLGWLSLSRINPEVTSRSMWRWPGLARLFAVSREEGASRAGALHVMERGREGFVGESSEVSPLKQRTGVQGPLRSLAPAQIPPTRSNCQQPVPSPQRGLRDASQPALVSSPGCVPSKLCDPWQ